MGQSYLRTPANLITLDGKVSRDSQLQGGAQSSNLHELERLAVNLRGGVSGMPPQWTDVYGSASFNGFITGLVTKPHLQGKLEARNLRVKGSSWKLLRASVDADPSALSVSGGYLEAATEAKLAFDLRTGTDEWAYTPASPIKLEISASQIAFADVASLANQTYPVSGMLSGNASVHGSQLNPVGHGDINLANGKIFTEPIQSLNFKFQGDGKTVRASVLLHLPAGTAHAQMTLDPKTLDYQAQIQADNRHLEQLQAVKQRKLPIAGAIGLADNRHGNHS